MHTLFLTERKKDLLIPPRVMTCRSTHTSLSPTITWLKLRALRGMKLSALGFFEIFWMSIVRIARSVRRESGKATDSAINGRNLQLLWLFSGEFAFLYCVKSHNPRERVCV